MSVEQIRAERETREAKAASIAATLPVGHYHAFDCDVVNSDTREAVVTMPTHWDACLVMLATVKP